MRVPLLIVLLFPFASFSQQNSDFYEISVFFNVQGYGGVDIPAMITDNNDVYLSVTDVFDFLRLRNTASRGFDSISGFFIDQHVEYLIDRNNNRIIIQDRVFDLKPDEMIRTETGLYLRTPVFGQVFGLVCTFDFRQLMVTLKTELELPLIREMRQEQMRSNLNRLKGEVKADTSIGRSYPGFHFGMADWNVYSNQTLNGLNDTRVNLIFGAILAGGETNISLNYNNNSPFIENEQYYLWRYVNNDLKFMRQAMLGKIPFRSTSTIWEPVVGGLITNTPASYRQTFGSYTIAEYTQPGWVIELYVNNVLVDYVQSDASGFYQFEVPLVYGNSAITLRFYGPWGEERIEERTINIPFTFLPHKNMEYTVSAGLIEDEDLSRYSRSYANYGLTRAITVGGGVEYNSSVTSGTTMPFVNTSIRLPGNLLVSGEYTYGVVGKGVMSYQSKKNVFLELYYSRFNRDQTAVIYNYLEERKAVLSVPIRGRKFGAYSRLTIANQVVVPGKTWTRGELLFTGNIFGINTNFTTYGIFSESHAPNVYSDLSLGFRFSRGLTIIPSIQYQYNQGEFVYTKCRLECPLVRYGFLTATYEQSFNTEMRSFEIGFRYDFSFARASLSVMRRNERTHIFSSANGSFIYDKKSKYLGAHNRASVGRGGLVIVPFLDMNFNNTYDPGEPKVYGLNIRINAGRIERTDHDTTIRVFDLMPYTTYLLELDKNSFDNIAWQLKYETISIEMDANKLKRIEIPITVMGEASGMVYLIRNGRKRGQERIIVNIFDIDSLKVARVLTEWDGYFTYMGLPPGSYTAQVDVNQLDKLSLKSTPPAVAFRIKPSFDGDYIDDLEFTLESIFIDTMKVILPVEDTLEVIAEVDPIIGQADTLITEPIIEDLRGIFIQIGAFENEGNAMETYARLKAFTGRPVSVVVEDGYHKVRLTGFDEREDAIQYIPELVANGFPEWYLIRHTGDAIPLGVVVQVGKFNRKSDAIAAQQSLSVAVGQPVMLTYEDGKYIVWITGFENSREASRQIRELITAGYPDAYVYGKIRERALAGIVIQVGAFREKEDAISAQRMLKTLTNHPVMIVIEGGVYRVRVTGFADESDASTYIPDIVAAGYDETYFINKEGEKIPMGAVVQVAAYERKFTAFAAKKNLSGVTGKGRRALVMVEELPQPDNEHNKVRISGFADTNEMKQMAPKLVATGFPESSINISTQKNMLMDADAPIGAMQRKTLALQVRKQLPVLVINEDGKSKVWIIGFASIEEAKRFMPNLVEAGYPRAFIIKKTGRKPAEKAAIQVGVYDRKEDAIAAQKKLVKVIGRYALISIEGLRPIDDEFKQLRISGFVDSAEMKQVLPGLVSEGFPETGIRGQTQVNRIDRSGAHIDPLQRQSYALEVPRNNVKIIKENGLNKLRITALPNRQEAEKMLASLEEKGFKGSSIIDGIEKEIPFKVFIQAGSYKLKKNALSAQRRLIQATGKPVVIIKDNDIFKVRVAGFNDSLQASKMLPEISKLGFPSPFVIHKTK
ncbi:MAG: SPOR domain-containing protein [Bacteroidota bacterium]|nr:SPOR domain-containing protein [Bacteroidota bacterium]